MPTRRKLCLIAVLTIAASLILPNASAEFPQKSPTGDASDPYAYQNYMFTNQFPPSDLGGDIWKYSSKNACELYLKPDPKAINCDPTVISNPQELFGVTGASIDKAWETTTGRPDVVIAVHDSGIKWNDGGVMNDLNNKTWLNKGELPEPNWGTRDPNHPYDRNGDGVFNIQDYSSDSRVSDLNANGIIDPEDLIFRFSDGVDTDGNGYKDDFVGWDTYEDDNDPYDEVQYGHGSGEAQDSTGEINNGNDAGVCPNCMVMHMRVGDSFIADVNDFAEGAVYAVDNGASVLQSALGTLNNSRFAQEAINYAYRRGAVFIASAADESAGHHNQPSVLEHAVTVNSVGEPTQELPSASPKSYLDFRGCTNFGAYITAAVPSNSCSSEATGRTAGMAGLIYGAARNSVALNRIRDYGELDGTGGVGAGRGVSAEEVDQIIATTADDLDFFSPLKYDQRPGFPVPTERYPATTGWDPFFGYGRVNARRMVEAVKLNKIPPEADITSPRWFDTVDPGLIQVEGLTAARRAPFYSYTVKWGLWSWRDKNAAPSYTSDGVTLTHNGRQTSEITGRLATIDPQKIRRAMLLANGALGTDSGPGVDPQTGRGDHENRQFPDKFGVIVRLEVTALDSAGLPLTNIDGRPLTGIGTKDFNFHHDPALAAGFPKDLQGDGAAPPRFADIDNDGADELIVATSNGEIHAYESSGGEVPGWPVHTSDAQLNYGAPSYHSGEITTPVHSAVLRSPVIGDLDRDGDLEVVTGDFQGRLWVFDRSGSVLPGFPVRSNPVFSQPDRLDREANFYDRHPELITGRYPGGGSLPNDPDLVPDLVNRKDKLNRLNRWFTAAPTLANIDGDPQLEILAGSYDRHLYVFNADGSAVPGWPVILRDPAKLDAGDSIDSITHWVADNDDFDRLNSEGFVVSPAVGDIDGDGTIEVIATVNEQYKEVPNTDDAAIQALCTNPKVLFPTLPKEFDQSVSDCGNSRVYALFKEGSLHGKAPGQPPSSPPFTNAFLPGWPAKIATPTLELLPVVGNGPAGAPVVGNVYGDQKLEVGILAVTGPAYIFGTDGASVYGREPGTGRDRTLLVTAAGAQTNSPADSTSIPAAGGAILSDLLGNGRPVLAVPGAGLGKLLDVVLPEDQLASDNHLSVWDLSGTRAQLTAWPREVNDLQFLSTPASADIDGDGKQELLNGTAYSDLHAFNSAGAEPGLTTLDANGWPKFTGGWTVGPPAVGDWGGDGKRDVAHSIREGRLYVWKGNGARVCDPASWPEFGHDGWNTNNITTDATRPRVITDLSASGSGPLTLSWTAPGDDGTCGTAHSYEIRTSANPINAKNFNQATLVSNSVRAAAPGTKQTVEIDAPRCESYVAVRTWDADPAASTAAHPANPSAVSNNVLIGGPCADVSVNASAAPSPVKTGKTLTYTVTVANAGPATAAAVTLGDSWTTNVPGGVTFVSVSTSRGSCVKTGTSTVTCSFGALAKGASALVTIQVKPKGPGSISNTATVATSTIDPNMTNNNTTISTTVNPP